MNFKDMIKIIEQDGWYQLRQKGSHRQFKHHEKKGVVTIAYHHLSDEIAPGTFASIKKQAQLQ